jgi:transglutaminase-like putative cysteine protease
MNWVYRNIEKRPVMTVPGALEVLKTRVGDCNEHAVLLTALLRASGIPARLCVGLVYSRGQFFYHAWTEAYVGVRSNGTPPVPAGTAREFGAPQDGWISLDATLNQMPVDPTHIKLAQGGLDKQVGIIGLVGKLQLEIVELRYD